MTPLELAHEVLEQLGASEGPEPPTKELHDPTAEEFKAALDWCNEHKHYLVVFKNGKQQSWMSCGALRPLEPDPDLVTLAREVIRLSSKAS